MSKTSVIIPTYNRAKYLPEAIDSVLNQTCQDFEIIVVDDGSTDETAEVVKSYIKSTIEIKYIQQENQGPGAARNSGIREAKGKYIAFIDSDEVWKPEKLEKQIKFLEKNPDYEMVYTDVYEFNNGAITKKSVLVTNDRGKMSGMIIGRLIIGCFISLSTVTLRREVIDAVGVFNTDLMIAEDWDLWLRVASKYKIWFIDEVLVGHRIHPHNLTSNIQLELECRHRVVDNVFAHGAISKQYLSIMKLAHSRIFLFGGQEYLCKKEHRRARRELVNSIFCNPAVFRAYPLLLRSLCPPNLLTKLKSLKHRFKNSRKFILWKA